LANATCGCGSLLPAPRCCALDPAALPGTEALALLDPQGEEATRLFNAKKYAEAETLALRVLELAPNQRLALRVLFELRRAQKQGAAAEVLARRLAGLPGTPAIRAAANTQLATLLVGQGRYAAALAPAEAAVIAAPRDATTQHMLGVVLTETGRLTEGERHYRLAAALLPERDGLVLANTAWNLKLQGRLDEAAALYTEALTLRPENRRAVGGFAQVELGRGHAERAAALLQEGLVRWPEDRTLRLLRAMAELGAGEAAAVLARLPDPEGLLAPELCTRGEALDRLGRPAEAVAHFAAAKRQQRERNGLADDPAPFQAKAAALESFTMADRMAALPRAVAPAVPPLLLLGFPRSGTSLLEQLLAGMPGIAAGDEYAPVAELVATLEALTGAAFPLALDRLLVGQGAAVLDALRARHEAARARFLRPGIRFVTDRSFSTLWHLPLFKLLYPDAPVIHLLRHPLDVVLANFAQEKRQEGNFSTSLPSIARHYALTMAAIRHARGQLTLRYLPLRYEDMVADPAAALARIADFLGLDRSVLPEAAALRANAFARPEPTPAHFAGRAPVHARSRYRYLAYQEAVPDLFTEIRPILAPWIDALGYDGAEK
jgi:tetratricopeptide (TPR) repeat protein